MRTKMVKPLFIIRLAVSARVIVFMGAYTVSDKNATL